MAQASFEHRPGGDFELLAAVLVGLGAGTVAMDEALERIRGVVGADACELFQCSGDELLLVALCGDDPDAFASRPRFEIGAGFPGAAVEQRRTVRTNDLAGDSSYLRESVKGRGYRSFASVPLLHGESVVGTIDFAWKRGPADIDAALASCALAFSVLAVAIAARSMSLPSRQSSATAITLEHVASWFRSAGEADSATVFIDGVDALHKGFAGDTEVACNCLADGSARSCPRMERSGRCIVYEGPRESWPRACRSFPAEFATVVGVPLAAAGTLHAMIYLGYRRSPSPSTRHCPPLLALARDVAPFFASVVLPPAPLAGVAPRSEAARPRLRVQCFGSFRVWLDGRELTAGRFSRAKAIEAMKLLIMRRGRAVTRGELIDQLWPGTKPASGTRNLHVTIHALRSAIEPAGDGKQWTYVLRHGHGYSFAIDACDALDLRDFRKRLARAHTVESEMRPLGEVIEHFEAAVSLYTGDLFGEDGDAEWCVEEREGYRTQATDALVHLAYLAKLADLPDRHIAALTRAVEIDPLREDVQQHLVRALWDAGRRTEAQRQYGQFVDTLRDELGVTPLPETLAIGERIGIVPRGTARHPAPRRR